MDAAEHFTNSVAGSSKSTITVSAVSSEIPSSSLYLSIVFSIVPSLGSEWLQRKAGCIISTSLTGRYMVGISGSSKIKIPKSEPQDTGLHALFSFQLMHHLGLPTTSPLLSDPCFTKRVKIKILGACPCLICPSHICHIAGDIWKAQFSENAPAVEGA
ncbi:hypothetical protein OROMI_014313 [Orobanche minor]